MTFVGRGALGKYQGSVSGFGYEQRESGVAELGNVGAGLGMVLLLPFEGKAAAPASFSCCTPWASPCAAADVLCRGCRCGCRCSWATLEGTLRAEHHEDAEQGVWGGFCARCCIINSVSEGQGAL